MGKEDHYDFDGSDGLESSTGTAEPNDEPSNPRVDTDESTSDTRESAEMDQDNIPLIFRRQGQGVKYERDEYVTVYMLDETKREVTRTFRDMEDRFSGADSVRKLDVYEALIRAGLQNQEDVIEEMEAFGYGLRE